MPALRAASTRSSPSLTKRPVLSRSRRDASLRRSFSFSLSREVIKPFPVIAHTRDDTRVLRRPERDLERISLKAADFFVVTSRRDPAERRVTRSALDDAA